ncbi:unnamed protein product [Choristocarpus tenellus]
MSNKRRKNNNKSSRADGREEYWDDDYLPEDVAGNEGDSGWSNGAAVSKRSRERLENLSKVGHRQEHESGCSRAYSSDQLVLCSDR